MRNRRERIRRLFAEATRLSDRQQRRQTIFQEILVSGQQELNDKIAELNAAVEADEAADQALVDDLDSQIQQLKDQLASNQPVDTQAQIDALEGIKSKLVAQSSQNSRGGPSSGSIPNQDQPIQ